MSSRLDTARHWLEIATALGAKYLQVASQFDTDNSSGDWPLMVLELQELSDLAASYSLAIAYEAVAWGSYVNTWEDLLCMVKDVNCPNFGVCLDSFHVAAHIWGVSTMDKMARPRYKPLSSGLSSRAALTRFSTCSFLMWRNLRLHCRHSITFIRMAICRR